MRERNSSQASKVKDSSDLNDAALHSCLSGKRIVFIGPSTSKFDYIALAYFAEYGKWPLEDQVVTGPATTGPNPLYEWNVRNVLKAGGYLPEEVKAVQNVAGCNQGGGTETFMRYTNHILNAHEVCDCHQNGDWKGAGDWYNATENRVYQKDTTMISYFQWFGDTVPPRGTVDISPALQNPAQAVHLTCPVGQFPGKWAWTMTLTDFIQNVVKYANPTHVVISAAFWPTKPENAVFWDGLAQAGAAAVQHTNGQVFWRTTPQRTDHPSTDPATLVDTARFLQNGWKVFPAQQIVLTYQGQRHNDEMFYDYTHLRPPTEVHLMQTWLQQNVCTAAPR